MADLRAFALTLQRSGMAPRGMDTPEAIMIAVQLGAEIGLLPMQSLQNVAVINGRPSIWGDAALAICMGSGLFDTAAFDEDILGNGKDDLTATCTVRRLPGGKPVCSTFSVENAKQAGLWGKKGPWQEYPRRMLQMRARGFALRDAFPDVLKGMRFREEAQDIIEAEYVEEKADDLDALTAQLATPSEQGELVS